MKIIIKRNLSSLGFVFLDYKFSKNRPTIARNISEKLLHLEKWIKEKNDRYNVSPFNLAEKLRNIL